jgi:hypothetical protein
MDKLIQGIDIVFSIITLFPQESKALMAKFPRTFRSVEELIQYTENLEFNENYLNLVYVNYWTLILYGQEKQNDFNSIESLLSVLIITLPRVSLILQPC